MKKNFVSFIVALFVFVVFLPAQTTSQTAKDSSIRFDGLYIAKTKEITVANNKMEIYMYLRFYDDGTVYSQAVNSFAPEKVAVWFGKKGRFEKAGVYKIEGQSIHFSINNDKSPDKALEGPLKNSFNGKIESTSKLFLEIDYNDGDKQSFLFEFVPVK